MAICDVMPHLKLRHMKIANDHLDAGSWRMAEIQCRTLLADHPADIEATMILGLAIAASGEAARAAPLLERVRRARPDHPDPCRDFATMEPRIPRALVTRQYRASLRLAPANARLRHDFARYLLEKGESDAALVVLRDAMESAETCTLRGMALAETGRFKEAARCFDSSSRLNPDAAGGWSDIGMMMRVEGRFDEALVAYNRAISRDSSDPRIRVDHALALLHAGSWDEGWREYEWRFRRPGYAAASDAPLLGSIGPNTRLDGQRVLVWHEDGLGDTLQFSRYLPLLARLGAVVTVSVPAPLVRLLRGISGINVVRTGDPRPHDVQCPFLSLPRAFATTPRTVPSTPWLAADPALAATWDAQLPGDGLRVGLVWSGHARPWLHGFTAVDRRRSMPLAAFAPLATVPGVRFISLQAGTPAAQGQEPPPGMDLTDPMDTVRDFADTAALIDNLDVVISVDTAVSHLAGAMGKRVFLLDRYDNCWRWMHGRTDTPWYPSMTIFRQPRPGDWMSVMHRASSVLATLVPLRNDRDYVRPELATAA